MSWVPEPLEPFVTLCSPLPFPLPPSPVSCVQDFFRELSWRQASMGVTSLQLSMTTLEDVFLRIARMAELEVAAAEGRYATVALPSGVIIRGVYSYSTVLYSALLSAVTYCHLLSGVTYCRLLSPPVAAAALSMYHCVTNALSQCVTNTLCLCLTVSLYRCRWAPSASACRGPSSRTPRVPFWLIDIEWQQDDNGNLCMSRFTDPVPEGRPGAPVPRAVREQLSCGSTPTILPLNARQRSLVATPVHKRGL